MDNLPLDLLDLNNGLNNDNNGGDDSSSGSTTILDLLRCQNEPISTALEIPSLLNQVRGSNLCHFLEINFVKNLHIHIFFYLERSTIRLRGKYKLAQEDTLIKDF